MFDLTGKVAVVTGASSGLGRDAAVAYAEYGADVALLARRYDRLVELKEKIEKETGRKALAIKCDVTNEDEIKAAVDEILNKFGKIDILLNNAGVNILGDVVNLKSEDWDTVLSTNLRSDFLTSKYVVPHMIERNYGKIVNIASVNAVVADKDEWIQRPAYNASKAGVVGLTMAMSTALAKHGITVNAIGPGLFPTEMTEPLFALEPFMNAFCQRNPASRPANPGELNGAVIFLSSDASKYCQGQFIVVDGGDHLV
ncbi:MAG: SDR family oxidoreductase [Oscillospiraceae bacterium]|nr:SDR family oxidoreductase [Oscillospiraceae bacterium]